MIESAITHELGATVRARVAIIGLGAGGSMAFHDLACAGVDVLALELGGAMGAEEMTRREEQMLPQLFMEGASRATADMSIRVLQGKGVGGSTLHNTNLCKRLPEELLDRWAATRGLVELARPQMQRDFEAVEQLLGVAPVPPERVNYNNRILERGLRLMGWRGGRLRHNRNADCEQSGFCELGCPNDGKNNAARALIPPALKAGGRVLTRARVDRLELSGGRVRRAHVTAVDAHNTERHQLVVEADTFVLAASATNSAALARRSQLPDPYQLAGTNLHMHPGAFVVGLFEEPVYSWLGVPQSVDCTEFLDVGTESGRGRVWIVTGAAHPGAAAGLVPGFGPAHGEVMRRYPHAAVLINMLHDESAGRVMPGPGAQVELHYRLSRSDWGHMLVGLRQSARLLLAAGAREVVLPLTPPRRIRRERDLAGLTVDDLGPFSPPLVAVHPMSTLWMGDDPRRSVVDVHGRHHQVPNLFVADGSLFPTSIGGPPQIPIYTMGRRVARAVRDRHAAPT